MNRRLGFSITVVLATGIVLSACVGSSPTSASATSSVPTQGPGTAPGLRLVNAGSVGVAGLVVVFPDERVEFGDVAAGAATTYRPVGKGVYRYAAYQAQLGGRTVSQPVIDWVGESPMTGEAFTYTFDATEGPPWGVNIRLVGVTRDR